MKWRWTNFKMQVTWPSNVPCVFTRSLVKVPCVLTFSRAKVSSRVNVPCVLMCWRTNVPCVFTRSRAKVPCVPTYQLTLRAYMLHISTCFVRLWTHVSTWLASSGAHMPWAPYLTRLVWLLNHLQTCFVTSLSSLDAAFSVSLSLLLNLYRLYTQLYTGKV